MGDHIPVIIDEFDVDIWVSIIDGQIDDRPLEAITDYDDLRKEIRYEAEIALRNEVGYRLSDRGVFPDVEHGWSERLNEEEDE